MTKATTLTLHRLHEPPPEWLGAALERFEHQFTYPLGEHARFRISHGRDYLPFFAAMGQATLLVAEAGGEVLGTLARVERWIMRHGEMSVRQMVHYLADLKVSPTACGGRVLARLLAEAKADILRSRSRSCYGIVMQGTGRLPTDYTGRLGVPVFERLAEIMVLRVSTGPGQADMPQVAAAPALPACVVTGGTRGMRSLMLPVPIPGSTAWLEDTRRGKTLWTDAGEEMVSAHLTGFHFNDPAEGAAIIQAALPKVEAAGMKALFTAVPASACAALLAALPGVPVQASPATIFGVNLPSSYDWWVDTAEI
ncbi:MAG: N-acetyltransferase [Prosthecobacter sp.]